MTQITCKVAVIGAGPGGYVTAIRAGQLGLDTVIVESAKPGGTCLNVGCIPSKALIHTAEEFHKIAAGDTLAAIGITTARPDFDMTQAIAWKDGIVTRLNTGVAGLLKKAKVRSVSGTARFVDGKTLQVDGPDGAQMIKAEHIVIATGSAPVELPFLPFSDSVLSSTDALSLTKVPETLAVVGGGYIGLELGTAFAKLGSKVTVIEAAERILPQYDAALTKPVSQSLASLGVEVLTQTKALGQVTEGLRVETSEGTERVIAAEKILVTVGRKPVTNSAAISELGLDMDGPFIAINGQCRTSMRGVWAIGDVTGDPMLAHRAMAQGEMVAEIIVGKNRAWDDKVIPAVCFTDPEIVTCGLSPDQAKAKGIDIKTGQFPFAANGRAMTMQAEAGFVRIVAEADTEAVLGIQAVGAGISELAAAFSVAMEMGACLGDIAAIVQSHPTQGEALQEAALAARGHALHI